MKLTNPLKTYFLCCRYVLLLTVCSTVYSQVNFTQSNLPIVIITTDINPDTGQATEIPDEPKVAASMKIIYHEDGSTNYVADQDNDAYLDYDGRIKIEIRGSTSQDLPKKQYGWTTYEDDTQTKQNVSILGMPKENDWILNGLAFDPSLMRDYISYNLSRQIGYYTSRTQYCEVIINGEYKGLYILQEKLKDDSNRINIEEIDEDASTGMSLTGGYITKADKTTGGDPVAWSMDSYEGWTDFIHEVPKPEDVTPQQDNYIHQVFTDLATTANSNNINLATGYPSIIDIPTFVDFMVMNELGSNADGYQISTFFHKDIGGKLRAGPIWDFNLTFGNDLFIYGFDRSHTDVWQFSNGDNEGPKFWTDLFNNPEFKCYFSRRWNALTAEGQPLNYNSIDAYIDEIVAQISDAAVREQQTWGTVPNWSNEIADLKSWIAQRINWITANAGSYSACENPELPSLVITGISYHPGESDDFPESDDQEFIQITNTGTTEVNLTGVYLRELGVSYQFTAGSTIAPGAMIYIVSNPEVFELKYGTEAFGQFQRNLSNSTQNLVLADGFGNIIDAVQYDDDAPWPDTADGDGYYLHLIDNALDNSIASSWEAIQEATLSNKNFTATPSFITLYPNPVYGIFTVKSAQAMQQVEIYDVFGKQLQHYTTPGNELKVDINLFPSGIYFVKVTASGNSVTKKIVKS
ncbi:CotH kinase family protein [Flavobacterium rhizosphaerae]|uniref:CotH kinase family protein n=1 Tax=Flavobacterium rhizosphaerae TaxID=3163298 RepID=A0ABW8YZH1_9FLAO